MLKSLFNMQRSPAPTGEGEGGGANVADEGSWAGMPASDDELVGKSLNETYVVEAVLGEGGMGRVYRAHHTRIAQKRFAIKVLRPEFTRNQEVVARFRREAEVAACISHPNVVGVYDVDTTDEGFAYIVCEFLEGIDLAEMLQRSKQLDAHTAVHIVIQMCRALEAAHERGIVHRDLKPHNVFLLAERSGAISPRPTIKVLDFGLSRFMDSTDTQLTRTGVIMGTPAYMSPEQASAKVVDHRSDIYGVGAVLYAALTGRPPFVAEHLQGVVLAVLTEEPKPARQLNAGVPENLELVMQRAMAKSPDERYQTMAELRAALEPFAEADTFFESTPVASREGRRRASRSSRAMLEEEAHAVSTARPRLLAFAAIALVLLVSGLASSVTTLELLTGKLVFSNLELGLLLLGMAGTLLTPGLLFVRRLRKTVWGNHVRVLELLTALKTALLIAVLTYGACALLVRFLDDVLSRFELWPLFGRPPGTGWPGWNALFFIAALGAAILAIVGRRYARAREAGWFATFMGRAFAIAIPLLAAAILYAGFIWRASLQPAAALVPAPVAAPTAPLAEKPSEPSRVPPQITEPQAPSRDEPVLEAPHEELARATAAGVEGLLPLAERYPNDPAVLKPLVLAFASRATGLADAMAIAKRVFAVAPEETRDPDLRFLVKRGAASPGEASKLAFEIMAAHMGSTGPDLLYELATSGSKAAKRAEELLQTKAVAERASPALLVARELRAASSCAARLPLLARAAELGDERSVAVLAPLSVGSKRGCGRWKRSPCAPACASEASRYSEAVARIQKRLAATRAP